MRILVLGADGYLGWPSCMHFAARGHTVLGLDNMAKRSWEGICEAPPLYPVASFVERATYWNMTHADQRIETVLMDVQDGRLYRIFDDFKPNCVIHYAEQPSAPYSMRSVGTAIETQMNNIKGTLNLMFAVAHSNPHCHIIKLGSMGEYGTPNIPIEEGWLDVEHKGFRDRVLFPKRPGSFYHLSKVHDSHNLEFGCRNWGLRVTDLNQGIVYGYETPEMDGHTAELLNTSFHYDAIFGTVLNRFIVQASDGLPLTVYGVGHQFRGFLNIVDTMQCIELTMTNPPEKGEFRVVNQFTEIFSVLQLAEMVSAESTSRIERLPNPRVEAENHKYMPIANSLPDLGLDPVLLSRDWIRDAIQFAHTPKNDRALRDPDIQWRQE